MTPQQLRNSILQMAIEGKLVEQRPEEGTGEELYQVIQEEKKALIQAGKLKKQKVVPEITEDEIPFEIPKSWKWCKLSELCIVLNGDRGKNYPAKSSLSSTGIPFVSAVNIKNKMVSNDENLLCMTNQQYDNLRSGKLEKGDIVFCIRGSLGKYGYYPFDKGAIASSLVILKACYNRKVFIEYLMIYLETPLLFSEIKKYDNGTAQPNLSAKNLEKFLFPLPPIEEQKRIVEKIKAILLIIDRYENAWQKLNELNKKFPEELQKSILQEAIQGRLCKQRNEEGSAQALIDKILLEKERLIESGQIKKQKALPPIQEDEIPFDIPESWEWSRVGTLVHINPKNDLPDESKVAFVPMACIKEGYRSQHLQEPRTWGEIKKGYTHFADNDIAIAKITPCFQNRKSVIFKSLIGGFGAGTTEVTIVRGIQNLLFHEYLLWFFKSDYFIANGVKSFTGTAGQQRIHKDYILNCLIPIPPLNEQRDIVKKINRLFLLIEKGQ